jgi:hypothetical protein
MMPFTRQTVDDQVLRAFLFGELAADEVEQLDELTMVDDEVAARLHKVEADLMDGYVRGELSEATREKFETIYLSTPERRSRVAFAEELMRRLSPARPPVVDAKPKRSSWLDMFRMPQLAFAGGLAMLAVFGVLLFHSLRSRPNDAPTPSVAKVEPPAAAPTPTAPPPTPSTTLSTAPAETQEAPSLPLSVFAFTLAPQLRGGAALPELELPQATTRVDFRLELETNDFPRYRVALKSLKSEKPLWQSSALSPVTKGANGALLVKVPAQLLSPGRYQLEVMGAQQNAASEFAGSYAFQVASH